MPKAPICQSCMMPLTKPADFGTNADGSRNGEYCLYCFQTGRFTSDLTMRQMIDKLVGFAPKMGMTEPQARAMAEDVLPNLKRWRVEK